VSAHRTPGRGVVWLTLFTLLLGGCFWRGTGPLTATPIPLLGADRPAIEARTQELRDRIGAGSLKGGERRTAQEELDLLTRRLAEGDLRVGDQLVITMLGDSAVSVDTATVRDGMLVSFAGLPDVDVARTLQSEVAPRLQAHTNRFFRNRTVRVTIPLRLAVLGQVARPGFYSIATDRPISEVVMLAGGPLPTSDLSQVVVRRDGRQILSAASWGRAQDAGTTIGALGLRPGDEVEIGRRRQVNWAQISQLALVAVGATVAFFQLLVLIYGTE
jgi:protein involved in polysaccharide export with SLBB domain